METSDIAKALKEGLTVGVSIKKEYDFGNESLIVDVTIYFNGEKICEGTDYISITNR